MIDTLKPGQTYKLTQYEKLGGETVIRQLVKYFYEAMDNNTDVKTIRDMHAADLTEAEDKLFLFLSGWLGGPSLYIEKYGHPRLRARHLPFSIGIKERDQWLHCMDKALHKMNIEKAMHDELMQAFFNTADFMRNQTE
ncbi:MULTISPECIES: group II truncated hemoglobin [Cycloclasticus]|uniref:Globin-like protein n=1 Tax=Cycloclasticus pugetii TaxID=34068 RepID=A0AB33Z1H0_9GAMM|nr:MULTISPECIES: group II truncated hemoglobin [Cycloclasticus]ATI02555.1 hemoglobin-like protein [Cycloclasticus sp. PY97N]EPD13023.1 globin-like protein [Cycloclasticus pugetii]